MVFCRERTRLMIARAAVVATVFLAVLAPMSKAEEDLAKTARYFLDRGDFVEAVQYFEVALAGKPEQKEIRVLCAFAYLKQNQLDKAEELLRQEIELAPGGHGARALLGLVYYRQGRGAEAEAACRESLAAFAKKGAGHRPLVSGRGDRREDAARENHNAGLPYFILGLLNKAKGRFAEAIEGFGQARELGYDPLACQLHILDAELGWKNWLEVFALSAEAVRSEKTPEAAEILSLRAEALDELGFKEDALKCVRKAAALRPYEAWSLKNLALDLLNRGSPDEALPFARAALWLAPADFQARFLLDQAEHRRRVPDGQHRMPFAKDFLEAAGPVYRHAFARDPDVIAGEIHNYALGLIRAGLLPRATEALRNFLGLYDLSPSLNYNLAQLYNSMSNWREALRYALRAIELKNNSRDAHDLVGNIFFKTGRFEDSAAFYRLAVIFAPQDALGYYNLGCVCRALKDDAEAEKNWRLAIEKDRTKVAERRRPDRGRRADDLHIDLQVRAEPVSFDAYSSLGSLYLERQKPEAALEAFGSASEIMPLRQEPYLEMGKLWVALKNSDKARDCFEKYISLGGDAEKVKALLK
jgi:tetratricopeptide (TPR) repeat protein